MKSTNSCADDSQSTKTNTGSESLKPTYILKPTYTPLPSAQKNKPNESGVSASKVQQANSVVRGANEDDDLYDPYSDFHDGTLRALEFEKDPWV